MVSAAVEQFGRIDVVVNNAGFTTKTAFPDVTLAGWRHMMAADVESASSSPSTPCRT